MQNSKSPDTASVRKGKRKSSVRFRLLPLVIFFCVLMLSVRVGVVWRNIFWPEPSYRREAAVSVTAVRAQSVPDEANRKKTADKTGKKADMTKEVKANAGKSFSQSELEILQKLAERREALDVRERDIDQKAGVLKAAEAQMDVKIAKLKELEASIKELIGAYDEKEKARLTNLVKIYSTMKPKEAARLFNDMEMSLLVRVFEQMKEAKSAPVLALMDSAKANALTAELANKKKLPGYDGSEISQEDKK